MTPICFICQYNNVAESGRMCQDCIRLIAFDIMEERMRNEHV